MNARNPYHPDGLWPTKDGRPEGAEGMAVAIFQAGAAAGVEMTPEKRAALADHLAAMGYRKDANR